jgi:hypothetical protein
MTNVSHSRNQIFNQSITAPSAASAAATMVQVGEREQKSLMAGRVFLNSYAAVVQNVFFL